MKEIIIELRIATEYGDKHIPYLKSLLVKALRDNAVLREVRAIPILQTSWFDAVDFQSHEEGACDL